MSLRIAALLLILPLTAASEELVRLQPNPQLTLSQVVEKAYQRSPQQQVLSAGKTNVNAKQIQAESLLPAPPAISVQHQNDAVGSNRNLNAWETGLDIPVWLPGQRKARTQIASVANDGLEASRRMLLLSISGQVRESLWASAISASMVELGEQRLQTAKALQNDVEKRWKAGELARTDVMLAQNETLQASTALLQAQTEQKNADYRYWILTGLQETPATTVEALSARTTLDDSHPELAELTVKVALARNERELVQVEKRENPQISVNARRERGAFDNQFNNSIGLAIRVPFDTPVRSAPLVANAEMALAQAMSEYDQQRLMLQSTFNEATHNLEVSREALAITEEQQRLAQENLQLAKKSFDLGESDLVSLLRVQAMAQEAERSLRNRRIQLQWNISRYNQAIGELP